MSHPSTGRDDVYPEDKVTHYPRSKHATVRSLLGLMHTKHFGAKHGARHEKAKTNALKKKRGESTDPF